VKDAFAASVQGAGLDKHVTPHTLKHTCASWMLQNGVDLWDVADFLKTSASTIEKIYGHHAPEHQERALRAFDSSQNIRTTNGAKRAKFE
jgi:integrase